MFSVTVRGMLTHRLRLVLTTASIALGVAFLAGTLILTDTMQHAFDQLYGRRPGTDVVVRRHSDYRRGAGGAAAGAGFGRRPCATSTASGRPRAGSAATPC